MEPLDVVTIGGHPAELGSCAIMCAMWRHNAVKPMPVMHDLLKVIVETIPTNGPYHE